MKKLSIACELLTSRPTVQIWGGILILTVAVLLYISKRALRRKGIKSLGAGRMIGIAALTMVFLFSLYMFSIHMYYPITLLSKQIAKETVHNRTSP